MLSPRGADQMRILEENENNQEDEIKDDDDEGSSTSGKYKLEITGNILVVISVKLDSKLYPIILETRNDRNDLMNPYWIDDRDLKGGVVDFLNGTEISFWKDLIEKYLAPINADDKKEVSVLKRLLLCFFTFSI